MGNLSITEQFVKSIFLTQTFIKVKEQFASGEQKVPLDLFGMNFRLFKATNQTINFEVLAANELGNFFKPIGFFTSDLSITLLNEFEKDYINLIGRNEISIDSEIRRLSLEANAVIAAFSMEVIVSVMQIYREISEKGFEPEFKNGMMIPANLRYDKTLVANGYDTELIMTFDGHPQFFLDDEYGLDGPIGAYFQNNGSLGINPIAEYKPLFDKLHSMSLLAAYKHI